MLGAALVLGAWWPLAVARLRVRREELAGLPDAPGVSPATAAPAASVGTHEALERGPRDPGWFPTTPEEEMRGLARESGEELFSPPTWAELRRLEQGDAEPVAFTVNSSLANGRLVDLFPSHRVTATSFETAVWLIYPSRAYLPQKVRAMIDFLRGAVPRRTVD